MLQVIQSLSSGFQRFFHPPTHIRLSVVGKSINECLRQLERKAGLPVDDLFIEGEPREVTTWPAMRDGIEHRIASKMSARWRADPVTEGYIAGTIFETAGPCELTSEQLRRMEPIVAAAVAVPHICLGNIHISKNCPGVYKDNTCMTCGNISR